MPLQSGTFVGPYKILALIGAGGMGEVYRASDPRLQRDVAVKIITALDEDRRRRFEIEARAAGSLNHPNIAAVYDVGESDGQPYIVSELVDGETLGAVLRRDTVATRELLDIAAGISAGLAEAHEAGITHRDLKPDNILLNRSRTPKIVDFGLAKRLRVPSAESTVRALTMDGVVMGTIAYMSPEQVRGTAVDHRSDQFSLGVIL
jgi:serine/threonine protein kinase